MPSHPQRKPNMNELLQLIGKLDTLVDSLHAITKDHEKRIRTLERFLAYGLGAAGAAKLLFDLLAK